MYKFIHIFIIYSKVFLYTYSSFILSSGSVAGAFQRPGSCSCSVQERCRALQKPGSARSQASSVAKAKSSSGTGFQVAGSSDEVPKPRRPVRQH